jgi:hypothetical protein
MLDPVWFYVPDLFDLRMLLIIYSLILSLILISQIRLLSLIPAGKVFILIALYVLVELFLSLSRYDKLTTLKMFRFYCLPLFAIGPIIYILCIPAIRLKSIIKWVWAITVLQGFFYILHHAGYSIFFSPVHETINFGSTFVERYNYAFPQYALIFMCASYSAYLLKKKLIYVISLAILLTDIILYSTRYIIVSALFSIICITILTVWKKPAKTIKSIICGIPYIVILSLLLFIIFPNYLQFNKERFAEISTDVGLRGAPTYNLRMQLLEITMSTLSSPRYFLFGNGYKFTLARDYGYPGDFYTELASQGDAPTASVLYCEGLIGLILRSMPFLIMFIIYLKKYLMSKEDKALMMSQLIIVLFTVNLIGWLQSPILRDFPISFLPFLSLHILYKECEGYTKKRLGADLSSKEITAGC